MLNLLLAAHLLSAALLAQDPPNPASDALDPIDQLGQQTCESFSAGDEVDLVETSDYADWVDERAPEPKDDYETENQFRLRQQLLWGAMLSESSVSVLSHPIRVSRSNSRYDPENQTLTLTRPYEQHCARRQSDDCLLIDHKGPRTRYLAIQGVALDSPLQGISPQTARRLREQDSADEITLFLVTTPIRPYRTREATRPFDHYHVGVYCAVYYWEDAE